MGLKIYSEILNEEFSSKEIKLNFKDKLKSFKPKITTKLIKISKYRSYFFLYGENIIIAIKRKFLTESFANIIIDVLNIYECIDRDLVMVLDKDSFKLKKDKKKGSLCSKFTLRIPFFLILKSKTISNALNIENSDIFSYCKEMNLNINTILNLGYKYREIINILDDRYFFIKHYFLYKANHNYNFQEMLNNGLNKLILNELKNETEQLLIEYNVPENGPRISLTDGFKIINSLDILSSLTI